MSHPSNRVTEENAEAVFTYHPPTDEQRVSYHCIRESALQLARVILANCPDCADRAAALRKVREAVMTANAAIALEVQ